MLAVLTLPLSLMLPAVIAKFTSGPNPLGPFMCVCPPQFLKSGSFPFFWIPNQGRCKQACEVRGSPLGTTR